MKLDIKTQFLASFATSDHIFEQLMALEGIVYRKLDGRETLQVQHADQSYFIKKHFGVGWAEIFKNLFQGRIPVLGAENEYCAIKHLQSAGVYVPDFLAFGRRGKNPAKQHSFVVMQDLVDTISLEDFCRHWCKAPPIPALKRNIIYIVAKMAKRMHQSGLNHRDFYLCHFLLDKEKLAQCEVKLYLIDLHRAQIRKRVPERWLIKDLAGLYFSAMDIGLTQRDLLRFLRAYFNLPVRELLKRYASMLAYIEKKAHLLYEKEFSKPSGMRKYYGH